MTNYNTNRKHQTTGLEPEKLDNDPNEQEKKMAAEGIKKQAHKSLAYVSSFKDDISVGEHVRVALETTRDMLNKLRKKGYNPNWSAEIYEVTKVKKPSDNAKTGEKRNTPIKYKLKGQVGWFYRLRLQKTASPDKQIGSDKFANEDPDLNREDNVQQDKDIVPDENNAQQNLVELKKADEKKAVEPRRSSRANKGVSKKYANDYV